MIGSFTQKKHKLLFLVLLFSLGLTSPNLAQTPDCYSGNGPVLDTDNTTAEICPGQKALLALETFPTDETAIWYGDANRTATLTTVSSTDPPFSPNPGNTRSYWVALRQDDGCESDLLEVMVARLDNAACPVKNANKGRSYESLQEAHDEADPGDEILLPTGQYQTLLVRKGLKFTGEAPLGQTKKAEVNIENLTLNSEADLELNNGVFTFGEALSFTKGNLQLSPNAALVIKGEVTGGDKQSAIRMPRVGQEPAVNFESDGTKIAPGAVRLSAIQTPGQRFLPLLVKNKDGAEEYFPILLETEADNTAEIFDLALAGPASTAAAQSYPGLSPEERAGVRALAQAANERPSKVDQVFLLGPADGNDGKLNVTVSAATNPGGPNHPILWNWEPAGIDPTIMTIDNDVALFRGIRNVVSGFNTYSTTEPVTSFSPFVIVEGPLLEGPPDTDMASVERPFQVLQGTLSTDDVITSPGSPCFDPATQSAGDRYFQVIPFTVDEQDIYTFQLDQVAFTGTGISAVYKGDFDETNLCRSLLFVGTENMLSDGSYYRDGKPLFRLPLEDDELYFLLTISKNPEQTGDYTWHIFSDGGGAVNADGIAADSKTFNGPILNVDLGSAYIPNGGTYEIDADGNLVSASSRELERTLLSTGYARFVGCSGATIQVEDVLKAPAPCSDDTIERTFTVISQSGCATPTPNTYTQAITVRKPSVAGNDFIASTRYTFIDRDLFTPDFNYLNAEGNPDPLITGAPLLATPFSFYELNGSPFPLSQRYNDSRFTTPPGVEGQFRREWNQSSFCQPREEFTFSQFIREADFPIYNMTTGRYYLRLGDAVLNAAPGDEIMLENNGDYTGEALTFDKPLVLVVPLYEDGSPGEVMLGDVSINIPGAELTLRQGVFNFEGAINLQAGDVGIGQAEYEDIAVRAVVKKPRMLSKTNLGPAFITHVSGGAIGVNDINVKGIVIPVKLMVEGEEVYTPLSIKALPGNQADVLNIFALGDIDSIEALSAGGIDAVEAEAARALARRVRTLNRSWLDNMLLFDPAGGQEAKLEIGLSLSETDFALNDPVLESTHEGVALAYAGALQTDRMLTGSGVIDAVGTNSATFEIKAFSPFVLTDCPEDDAITAVCDDLVNVTLLDGCSAAVTPDMVLEGYLGCGHDVEDFTVTVVYPDGTETEGYVDRPGRFIYEVTGPDGFNCGGEVQAEDKTAPTFYCTPEVIDHVYRTYDVQTARGALSEDQAGKLNFSDYPCFQDEYGSPGDCAAPYEVIEFYVSKADIYTFEAWAPESGTDQVENDNELHIALFQGDFRAEEPCANMLAQSNIVSEYGVVENDAAPDGRLRLALPLVPGQKYSLLVAREDCDDDRSDHWIVYAFSDNEGDLLDDSEGLPDRFDDPRPLKVKKKLYCSDLDYILNSPEYTVNPAASDNCDPAPETWFEDVLTQNGDCGEIYVIRTWYVRDDAGNQGQSCPQRIEFKRPELRDVQKPPTMVTIECDELQADWLDENGYPRPEIAGYPFVITAFGIEDVNEAFCNVGADYADISDIEVCPSTNKIVRQWTILDWCEVNGQWQLNNGTEVNWRQIIKVGDFSAPEGTVGDPVTVNAGPFSCTGVLIIPNIDVSDNCSDYQVTATVYKLVEEAELDKYGQPTGQAVTREELHFTGTVGSAVPDIEVGADYRLYYKITDACGNTAEPDPVAITAADEIEPVAVCVDDLTIGIGGEGIARITAPDIDEGSWDNCTLDTVLISRRLDDDQLRDDWLAQIKSLTFSDLTPAGNDDPSGDQAEQWINETTNEVILRRKNGHWYTAWDFEQFFICDDMNAAVTIELAAFDGEGNVNVCWMSADVEDKIAPFCIPPAEIVSDCTDLPYGFDPADDTQLETLFGPAASTDNCPGDTAYQVRKEMAWDCNSGVIERWFRAEDKNGLFSTNNCYQKITILPVHDYEIRFPADADAECGVPSPDTVLTKEIACDLLSVNVRDERFAANEGDACYKIKRTYQVINWCEYDGEAPAAVIGRDENCDGINGEDPVYVLRRPEVTFVDIDDNESTAPDASPCNGAQGHLTNSDLEDRLTSTGYWQYTQYLKVYDRTPPVLEVEAPAPFCADNVFVRCSGDLDIPFTVSEECDAAGLSIEVWLDRYDDGTLDYEVTTAVLTGAYPRYRITGNYPIGAYAFEIRVSDGCNNSVVRTVPFEVVDCKAPTPICINGLAVELMPQEPGTDADGDGDEDAGAMAIWATDFEVGLEQDCSPGFTYSINRVGEPADINQQSLILTCDDQDTVLVEIYLWDNAYNPYAVQPNGTVGGPNYDHCVTYVVVQDNMFNLCGISSLTLAGLITTEQDQTVEDVEVRLSGPVTQTRVTAADGLYAFDKLAAGADYTIQPWKDNAHLNGVSTFDLVLLTKHLLGIRKLDSPYLMIAADVNRSRTISTLDLIQMRKLVLSVDTRFRNNSSWRFIPKDFVFPDPENPWSASFPEVLSFNDLTISELNNDFIGVKTGDLSGNAQPNSLLTDQRETAGQFEVHTKDLALVAGNEYRIPFTAGDLANIQGYQFTMSLEDLELIDIEYGVTRAEHLAVVEDGVLTTSWNRMAAVQNSDASTDSNDRLFLLHVRSLASGPLSERIRIHSRYTAAEAYGPAEELLAVALRFDGGNRRVEADRPKLEQNQPNPFIESTAITFTLPTAQTATLKIRDLNGRTLQVIRGEYARGTHRITLGRNELPAAGVYYYTLETDQYTETRKMIAGSR